MKKVVAPLTHPPLQFQAKMSASNFQRRAHRKKQSRLVFDPVEPASQTPMSPARLRYADPSTKKQRKVYKNAPAKEEDNESDGTFTGDIGSSRDVPSPRNSSQLSKKHPDSEDQPDLDGSKSESDIEIEITPSRRIPADKSSRVKNSAKKLHTGGMDGIWDSSDSSDGSAPEEAERKEEKRVENRASRSRKGSRNAVVYEEDLEQDEDSEQSVQEIASSSKKGHNAQVTTPAKLKGGRSFLSGGSSYNAPISSSRRRRSSSSKFSGRATPSKTPKTAEPVEISSDEDEDPIGIPTPKATQASSQRSKLPPSSVARRQRRNVIQVDSDDEDDDELPSLSQLKKKTPEISKLSLHKEPDDDDDDDDEDEDDDEDDDVVSSPLKRKRAGRKELDVDEDEDSDVVSSPLKRKRVVVAKKSDDSDDLEIIPNPSTIKGKQTASSDVDEGSDGNVMFVSPTKKRKTNQSTPTKSQGRLTRQQQPKKSKRTAKQKQMELLRRRRAGEDIDELTDSESEEKGPALYDSATELEVLSNFDDEESEADVVKPHKKKNANKNEDDDFIVEDDDEQIGQPGYTIHDIPLEFTHAGHKTKKEHFKDAVEWMVQRKINPGFNRDDPVYRTAFRKLDDELRGRALSTFTSSVWRERFTKALYARPIFGEEHLGFDMERMRCDACGRSNHPATFKIQFTGKAYYKETLEEVDNDPDSDDEDEHDDVNEDGLQIPAEDEVFYVGVVCKGNAETAHQLTHWKYGLNEWVVDQLRADGLLEPKMLAAREELSTKKRSKIAEDIVDGWENNKKIKQLYSELKAALEVASQGPKSGRWGR